jgi:hypothetical protein
MICREKAVVSKPSFQDELIPIVCLAKAVSKWPPKYVTLILCNIRYHPTWRAVFDCHESHDTQLYLKTWPGKTFVFMFLSHYSDLWPFGLNFPKGQLVLVLSPQSHWVMVLGNPKFILVAGDGHWRPFSELYSSLLWITWSSLKISAQCELSCPLSLLLFEQVHWDSEWRKSGKIGECRWNWVVITFGWVTWPLQWLVEGHLHSLFCIGPHKKLPQARPWGRSKDWIQVSMQSSRW